MSYWKCEDVAVLAHMQGSVGGQIEPYGRNRLVHRDEAPIGISVGVGWICHGAILTHEQAANLRLDPIATNDFGRISVSSHITEPVLLANVSGSAGTILKGEGERATVLGLCDGFQVFIKMGNMHRNQLEELLQEVRSVATISSGSPLN